MEEAPEGLGPAFSLSDGLGAALVGERDVDVVVQQRELGVAGVVAHPCDGGWVGERGEVVLG